MKHPSWLRVILFLLLYSVAFPLGYGQENHPPRLREVLPIGTSDWLSSCAKFEDAPNRDEIETSFVLYRDLLKAKEWKQAFTYWEKVHAAAPAADGRRATVYIDGIRLYRQFYKLSQDTLAKEQYVDRIFELYDEMGNCYPSLENIPARKAFDLFHKYSDRAAQAEIFQLCKNVLDGEPRRVPAYIMLPATELLISLYQNGLMAKEEARFYVSKLVKILPIGLEHSVWAYQRQQWSHLAESIPTKLLVFEQEQGFYDCDYFLEKYYKQFEQDSTNCELLAEVEMKLKKSGCNLDRKVRSKLYTSKQRYCNCTPLVPSRKERGLELLTADKYAEAEKLFYEELWEMGVEAPNARSLLLIAKICYQGLGKFKIAREYAKRAANLKVGWGAPYILIGRLYVASDSVCEIQVHKDWDNQLGLMAAMNLWTAAKNLDPEIAAEANKLIGKYNQYLPSKNDLLVRGLQEGDTVFVGCWIQEKTRIRAAK